MAHSFQLPEPTDPDNCPEPGVALITKYDLFKNAADYFKDIDKHAKTIAKDNYKTFQELMYYLIYSKSFSELEKARICFMYLMYKDFKQFTFKTISEESIEAFILSIVDSPIFYPKFLEVLLSYAGLHCSLVEGYAKGYEFLPGDSFPNGINHMWIACFINASCYLLDPLWSRRFIDFKHPVRRSVHLEIPNKTPTVDEFEEFYFLMDPAQAIFSHYPDINKWQLLADNTVPFNVFIGMPVVKPQFFKSSIEFVEEHRGNFHLPNGELILHFNYSSSSSFYFEIMIFDGDKLTSRYKNVEIHKYVLLETKRQSVDVYFRLPFAGEYIFILYNEHVVANTLSKGDFRAACLHRLICDRPSPNLVQYPGYTEINWGPNWVLLDYFGLSSMNNRFGIVLVARNEPAYIEFFYMLFKDNLQLKGRLTRHVENAPLNSDQFEDVSHLLDDKEKGYNVAITVRLPRKGYYGLEIFLNPESDEINSNYTHVAQYLIDFNPGGASEVMEMLDCNTFSPLPMPDPYLFMDKESYCVTVMDAETDSMYPQSKTKQSSISSTDSFARFVHSKIYSDQIPHETSNFDNFVSKNKDNILACIKKFIIDPASASPYDVARTIFIWLCSFDIASLNTSKPSENELEELLYFLKKCECSYTQIYDVLVSVCTIKTQVVFGHAKGSAYQVGKHLNNATLHYWNIIEIDGSWMAVDCNWGAKSLIGRNVDSSDVVYELTEYYFCPPPENFIYSHLPQNHNWTSLKEEVSDTKFESMVLVKPLFFDLGMNLLSHKSSSIEASDTLVVSLSYAKNISKGVAFAFTLASGNNKTRVKGMDFGRYVVQRRYRSSCKLDYHFRFPLLSVYRFIIYACTDFEKGYRAVCEYIIHASVDKLKKITPFPPAEKPDYGQTIFGALSQVELKSKCDECLLKSYGEKVTLEFIVPNLNNGIPNFIPRLLCDELNGNSLDDMMEFKGFRKQDTYSWTLIIHCDKRDGEFSLEIFMNDPNAIPNDEHILIWQFQLNIEPKMGANNSATYVQRYYPRNMKTIL